MTAPQLPAITCGRARRSRKASRTLATPAGLEPATCRLEGGCDTNPVKVRSDRFTVRTTTGDIAKSGFVGTAIKPAVSTDSRPPSIVAADRFGPWSNTIDESERRARLRAMQAITGLCTGPRGKHLADLLRRAEHEPNALEPALAALTQLAALDRRTILASFAAIHRPAA